MNAVIAVDADFGAATEEPSEDERRPELGFQPLWFKPRDAATE
jgi:hypothetical protein